jgi:hypothetical protein
MWEPIRLVTIVRCLERGWRWWVDPRRHQDLLHSPAGRLYAVRRVGVRFEIREEPTNEREI